MWAPERSEFLPMIPQHTVDLHPDLLTSSLLQQTVSDVDLNQYCPQMGWPHDCPEQDIFRGKAGHYYWLMWDHRCALRLSLANQNERSLWRSGFRFIALWNAWQHWISTHFKNDGNQFCKPFLSWDSEPGHRDEQPCSLGGRLSSFINRRAQHSCCQKRSMLPLRSSRSSSNLRASHQKGIPVFLNAPSSAQPWLRFYVFSGATGCLVKRK